MADNILSSFFVIKDQTVNGTATIYSDVIDLTKVSASGLKIGFWYKTTSETGTPNINITLEESYKSDGDFADSGNSALNVTDEIAHLYAFTLVPMRYARFKVVGQSGNPTDSVVNLSVAFWE